MQCEDIINDDKDERKQTYEDITMRCKDNHEGSTRDRTGQLRFVWGATTEADPARRKPSPRKRPRHARTRKPTRMHTHTHHQPPAHTRAHDKRHRQERRCYPSPPHKARAAGANRRRRSRGRGRSAAPGLARANHLNPHHTPTLPTRLAAYHTSPTGKRGSRSGKRAKWGGVKRVCDAELVHRRLGDWELEHMRRCADAVVAERSR